MKATLIMLDKLILVNESKATNGMLHYDEGAIAPICKVVIYNDEIYSCQEVIAGHEGTKQLNFNLSDEASKKIGYVPAEKLAEKEAHKIYYDFESPEGNGYYDFVDGFKKGFKAALSLTDKKYTREDIFKAMAWAILTQRINEKNLPILNINDVELKEKAAARFEYAATEKNKFMESLDKPKSYQVEYTESETEITVTKII